MGRISVLGSAIIGERGGYRSLSASLQVDEAMNVWDKHWAKFKASQACNVKSYPLYSDIVSYLPAKKTNKILEAGCGIGCWCAHLSQIGYKNVVGLDFSETAVKAARENARGVSIIRGDIRNLPFPDETFAFILSLGVVEHFKDPMSVIGEMARVLKSGGILFLSTPNIFAPHTASRFVSRKMEIWQLGYEVSYTPEALADLAIKAGLKVVKLGNRGLKNSLGFLVRSHYILDRFPLERFDHTFMGKFGFYSFCIARKGLS